MALTDRLMSAFGWERKSVPDYGRTNWSPSFDASWTRQFKSTDDYKRDIGDLDGNSLVMAVVNYTGIRLPEARPTVSKKNKEGVLEANPLHPLTRLIRRPNQHFIWANYSLALSLSWWIDGNVYFYKERSASAVERLWYLPHFLVTPRWPNDGKPPEVPYDEDNDPVLSHYEYRVPGRQPVLYPKRDVVHFKRGVNLSNVRSGVSAFEPLIKELYGDDKMAAFTAAIMRNMGIQVPIIRPKESNVGIKEEEAARMKESWMSKTTGGRAGEPVVFAEPVDVDKFGFSPTELDLSALRMIPESRVAAVTGIPAATLQFMVGLQNGTSYASSEQSRQQGYEEVIIPIQQAIAEEINWQLLPDFEKEGTAEFSFDTTSVRVLQEDQDAKFKRESDVLRSGGCTIDEFLEAIGRPKAGSPLGDIRYVSSLSTPMLPDTLIAKAEGGQSEPVDPALQDAASLAKFADVDGYLERLESQMKDFASR